MGAMRAKTGISERRACELMDLSRTVLHYKPQAESDGGQMRIRISELAAQRRRIGYRRIHALLRREGARVNVKRVHRSKSGRWISSATRSSMAAGSSA